MNRTGIEERRVPTYTKVLTQGTTDMAVVGIDFSEGRQVASFPELAPALPAELSVLESSPAIIGELAGDRLVPAEYARLVVQDVTAAGHRVQAVLARCGGAGLACRVAEELAVTMETPSPTVILFDPDIVDALHVYMQFERVLRVIQEGTPPETMAQTLSHCEDLVRRHSGDLGGLLSTLHQVYAPLVPPALAAWNIPAKFGAKLIDRLTVFTDYLLCASRAPIPVGRVPIHQVLSRDRPPVPGGQEQLVTRLDVDGVDLLATPEAARVTTDLIWDARTAALPS